MAAKVWGRGEYSDQLHINGMAPLADGGGQESTTVTTAVFSMTDPLASWMWASLTEPPRRVDHVAVDMDVFDRAAEVAMTLWPASSVAETQRAHEHVLEDISRLLAASMWEDEDAMDDTLETTDEALGLGIMQDLGEERGGEEQPSIWRVHPSIREQEPDAYEPKLVSIGPLHRGKESLQPMDAVKLKYVQDLIGRHANNNLNTYIKAIRECWLQARKQYSEPVKLGKSEFVRMLVVDGCFMIEYFLKRLFRETRETAQLSGVSWGFSHLRRDLMLLENQIPFFVLEILFDLTTINFEGMRQEPMTLMEIALSFFHLKLPRGELPSADRVHHLLHLYHRCLDPDRTRDEPHTHSYGQLVLYPFKKATTLVSQFFLALLYLLLIRKWPWQGFPTVESEVTPRTIPLATELHESGVKFKRKARKKDGVDCYLKVSFKEGILEIPFLPVEESTSSRFRNLIALEQCCPHVGSYFTSYAVFMNNIINTERDVALLRKYKIIESKLGNDKEVAKLFTTLRKGTHLRFETHYNVRLFKDVNKYCGVAHHRWRASLKSTYLGSPWSTISLLAGIFIFGLAITQAYFSITRR